MNVINKVLQNDQTIHSGDVVLLWQHLAGRYDTQELIKFAMNHVHDKDFKSLLSMGLNTINQQVKILEEYAENNNIGLPERPQKENSSQGSTEVVIDELMYKNILERSQTDLLLHISAISITYNNSLRKLYRSLLEKDIDNYQLEIDHGLSKNWLPPFPPYKN